MISNWYFLRGNRPYNQKSKEFLKFVLKIFLALYLLDYFIISKEFSLKSDAEFTFWKSNHNLLLKALFHNQRYNFPH